jgi:hypothetical protein
MDIPFDDIIFILLLLETREDICRFILIFFFFGWLQRADFFSSMAWENF